MSSANNRSEFTLGSCLGGLASPSIPRMWYTGCAKITDAGKFTALYSDSGADIHRLFLPEFPILQNEGKSPPHSTFFPIDEQGFHKDEPHTCDSRTTVTPAGERPVCDGLPNFSTVASTVISLDTRRKIDRGVPSLLRLSRDESFVVSVWSTNRLPRRSTTGCMAIVYDLRYDRPIYCGALLNGFTELSTVPTWSPTGNLLYFGAAGDVVTVRLVRSFEILFLWYSRYPAAALDDAAAGTKAATAFVDMRKEAGNPITAMDDAPPRGMDVVAFVRKAAGDHSVLSTVAGVDNADASGDGGTYDGSPTVTDANTMDSLSLAPRSTDAGVSTVPLLAQPSAPTNTLSTPTPTNGGCCGPGMCRGAHLVPRLSCNGCGRAGGLLTHAAMAPAAPSVRLPSPPPPHYMMSPSHPKAGPSMFCASGPLRDHDGSMPAPVAAVPRASAPLSHVFVAPRPAAPLVGQCGQHCGRCADWEGPRGGPVGRGSKVHLAKPDEQCMARVGGVTRAARDDDLAALQGVAWAHDADAFLPRQPRPGARGGGGCCASGGAANSIPPGTSAREAKAALTRAATLPGGWCASGQRGAGMAGAATGPGHLNWRDWYPPMSACAACARGLGGCEDCSGARGGGHGTSVPLACEYCGCDNGTLCRSCVSVSAPQREGGACEGVQVAKVVVPPSCDQFSAPQQTNRYYRRIPEVDRFLRSALVNGDCSACEACRACSLARELRGVGGGATCTDPSAVPQDHISLPDTAPQPPMSPGGTTRRTLEPSVGGSRGPDVMDPPHPPPAAARPAATTQGPGWVNDTSDERIRAALYDPTGGAVFVYTTYVTDVSTCVGVCGASSAGALATAEAVDGAAARSAANAVPPSAGPPDAPGEDSLHRARHALRETVLHSSPVGHSTETPHPPPTYARGMRGADPVARSAALSYMTRHQDGSASAPARALQRGATPQGPPVAFAAVGALRTGVRALHAVAHTAERAGLTRAAFLLGPLGGRGRRQDQGGGRTAPFAPVMSSSGGGHALPRMAPSASRVADGGATGGSPSLSELLVASACGRYVAYVHLDFSGMPLYPIAVYPEDDPYGDLQLRPYAFPGGPMARTSVYVYDVATGAHARVWLPRPPSCVAPPPTVVTTTAGVAPPSGADTTAATAARGEAATTPGTVHITDVDLPRVSAQGAAVAAGVPAQPPLAEDAGYVEAMTWSACPNPLDGALLTIRWQVRGGQTNRVYVVPIGGLPDPQAACFDFVATDPCARPGAVHGAATCCRNPKTDAAWASAMAAAAVSTNLAMRDPAYVTVDPFGRAVARSFFGAPDRATAANYPAHPVGPVLALGGGAGGAAVHTLRSTALSSAKEAPDALLVVPARLAVQWTTRAGWLSHVDASVIISTPPPPAAASVTMVVRMPHPTALREHAAAVPITSLIAKALPERPTAAPVTSISGIPAPRAADAGRQGSEQPQSQGIFGRLLGWRGAAAAPAATAPAPDVDGHIGAGGRIFVPDDPATSPAASDRRRLSPDRAGAGQAADDEGGRLVSLVPPLVATRAPETPPAPVFLCAASDWHVTAIGPYVAEADRVLCEANDPAAPAAVRIVSMPVERAIAAAAARRDATAKAKQKDPLWAPGRCYYDADIAAGADIVAEFGARGDGACANRTLRVVAAPIPDTAVTSGLPIRQPLTDAQVAASAAEAHMFGSAVAPAGVGAWSIFALETCPSFAVVLRAGPAVPQAQLVHIGSEVSAPSSGLVATQGGTEPAGAGGGRGLLGMLSGGKAAPQAPPAVRAPRVTRLACLEANQRLQHTLTSYRTPVIKHAVFSGPNGTPIDGVFVMTRRAADFYRPPLAEGVLGGPFGAAAVPGLDPATAARLALPPPGDTQPPKMELDRPDNWTPDGGPLLVCVYGGPESPQVSLAHMSMWTFGSFQWALSSSLACSSLIVDPPGIGLRGGKAEHDRVAGALGAVQAVDLACVFAQLPQTGIADPVRAEYRSVSPNPRSTTYLLPLT